jgi:hypothetical protein
MSNYLMVGVRADFINSGILKMDATFATIKNAQTPLYVNNL